MKLHTRPAGDATRLSDFSHPKPE
ncbi:hypothetical protein AGR1C_Cc10861 [Agrobacterium fabacearum TT111]|nr:hypothetical protein AGR1C_Cc10861 [Agrobacterium fabacearum TT111]